MVRKKWSPEELREAEQFFSEHIVTGTTPNLEDCKRAIKFSKEHGGELHNRKAAIIKSKIWNLIEKRKNLD